MNSYKRYMAVKPNRPHSVFEELLNTNNMLVWSIDKQYILRFFNESFKYWMKEVYGVSLVKGQSVFTDPYGTQSSVADYWRQQYSKALESREPHVFQKSFRVGDKYYLTKLDFFPIIEGDRVKGLMCYAYNVTAQEEERLTVEKELKQANSQLGEVLRQTQEMVFSIDLSQSYTGFNQKHFQAMHELFEGRPVIGKKIEECVPNYLPSLKGGIDKVLSSEMPITEELSYGKGMTRFYFDTLFSPVLDDQSKLQGISFFVRDITVRRKAELKANKSTKLLSSINRNIKEAIFRSTPNNKIKYVNQAFLDMFSAPSLAVALSDQAKSFYVDASDRDGVIEELTAKGVVNNREVHFRRLDGTTFVGLLSSTQSIGEKGEVYFDGAIRDITEIKNIQNDLERRNEELNKANQALDQFVYTASHDLKAPLGSIAGLLAIFKLDKDEKRREDYLKKMEESVGKLEDFIADIVDYSRNARQGLELVDLDLAQLIDNIIGELQFLPAANKIDIMSYCQLQAPVTTDRSRLETILKNLISNAINYSDSSKQNPYIKLEARLENEQLIIKASDNGIGIGSEHLEKIFDMFYRASEGGKGSGIGLYIVKEALEKLNGEVSVESELGEGSTFTLHIPLLTKQ